MKKLLLSSAALCGLAMIATPASAGIDLELGGFFKGYGMYVDQDDDSSVAGEARELDIIRHTEIHIGGETTLDNGLTVGFHLEAETDGDSPTGGDTFDVEESYAYFSGGWGRTNFGAEDGAAYLLQVATPSADSNIDGIRQYVQPVNYASADAAALNFADGYDYDQNPTGYADKLTYLSPIMNGFQLGLSYVPDVADATKSVAANTDDVDGSLGSAYEGAIRYEGMFNNVGVILGAGYSHVDLEDNTTNPGGNDDDRTAWNVGADFDIGPFGIGVAYMEDDFAEPGANPTDDDEETFVVGVDYTTGPFKFGATYYDQDNTANIAGNVATDGVETERWTGGVVYTYGPGMSFRGSVSHIEHDNVAGINDGGDSVDATSFLLGTDIKF